MLYELINDFPNEIINLEKEPFISIYQPTHRQKPESTQDSIRFKNLMQQVEKTLKEDYKEVNIDAIMKPLSQIAEDNIFWNHSKEGLAILVNEEKCLVYRLDQTVYELAVVSDSFHIKPLIRVFQSSDRHHVLTLSRTEFKIYEGNRYGFEEIEIDESIPTTLKDVLGEDLTEAYLSVGGDTQREINKDTEKFFRYVDKFVTEHYSNPTQTPLVLVTLTEHQSLFRGLSRNSNLLDEGVKVDPDSLKRDELKNAIWEVLEPIYIKKTEELVERYENSRAKFLGTDDIVEIARATVENKISTLLIEAERIIKGKILEDGKLSEANEDEMTHEDVLDDMAEAVFRSGGEVIVLPKERMPSTTGAAAIYRY